MGLQVKALHIGDLGVDWSRLVLGHNQGRKTWMPCISFLILGAETPLIGIPGIPSLTHRSGGFSRSE